MDVIRVLLAHGANPFLLTGMSRSALHIAVGKGHIEIVRLLSSAMNSMRQLALNGENSQATPVATPEASTLPSLDHSAAESPVSPTISRESEEAEDLLCCPITKVVMQDAVVAADGHTYEREAITAWLRAKGKSPVTQQPMSVAGLVPNLVLKHQIEVHLRGQTPDDSTN